MGTADERDGDYFGPALNRVARLRDTGHGGQILLSAVTAGLVRGQSPDGVLPGDAPASRLLTGTAASAGSYRGRARVIGSVGAADTLEAGDVLVCATTDPAWTPYLALMGALVTDAGGMLSYSAVVAREFGIPAVTGTRAATRIIPDGATVTVDGTSGTVVVEG